MATESESIAAGSIPEIAIIGWAGRFPGARTVDELWRQLCAGADTIHHFSETELAAAGVPEAALASPMYVRAGGLLDDFDRFDATFFGIAPREAAAMDPQHRLFLECAWEALEHSGYGAAGPSQVAGVFAGASANTYLWNVYAGAEAADAGPCNQGILGNDRDFLATRVSYKFDLTGPSLNIQTACSTSLVSVHLACQSLLHGECSLALAGGVSIRNLQREGYWFDRAGILAPDGRCRAFDADARGTVGGDGIGVVVLKRLQDAMADGDSIYAVIKGSAINNDGSSKAGYTAPGFQGQAAVVAEAIGMAGIRADSIGYVECHGTGTRIGDPIEIAALADAFRADTARTGFCAIGSIKTNIGHLDAAAGIAGLIKAALCLRHGVIPASLHFERPNPEIAFDKTPFYVNHQLSPWPRTVTPRRAGVSSFGIGGTNAHVVLEEAPDIARSDPAEPWQLLLLSAKTSAALDAAADNLSRFLQHQPDVNLADVAYTLQVGRRAFAYRMAVICRDVADAVAALSERRVAVACVADQDSAATAGAASDLAGTRHLDARAVDAPEGERTRRLRDAARQWLAGLTPDASLWDRAGRRRRQALPTYPFQRQRYWIEARRPFERAEPSSCGVTRTSTVGHTEPKARPELRQSYVAPRTRLERQIAEVWAEFFGYERVGIHDDFFDIGGDSAGAAELIVQLGRRLEIDLPIETLLEASTVAALAAAVSDTSDAQARISTPGASVVTLNAGRRAPPIFCIHPAGGGLFCYAELARAIEPSQTIYGIDDATSVVAGTRIEDLAAAYVDAMCRVQPEPPYALVGFSLGGAIAYEMAQQLRARQRSTQLLALIDTTCPHEIPAWCDDGPESNDTAVARYAVHVKALRAYTPRPYQGRLLFCRARERARGLPSHPESAWIDLAEDGAEIHVIPGDHRTMLALPGARLIARALERWLAVDSTTPDMKEEHADVGRYSDFSAQA